MNRHGILRAFIIGGIFGIIAAIYYVTQTGGPLLPPALFNFVLYGIVGIFVYAVACLVRVIWRAILGANRGPH